MKDTKGGKAKKLPRTTLRKKEGNGSWKRKHWIALFRELALEETMDLSQDGLLNESLTALAYEVFFPTDLDFTHA